MCWQCRARRVDDWVGRCVAESKTAMHTHSVSLTYGYDEHGNSDHVRTAILTYNDVRKFFWNLRNNGYKKFRYFCVGEFGSRKGRAHWHLVIFWYQEPPEQIQYDTEKFSIKYWPEGFSYWQDVEADGGVAKSKAVRYVCKYLNKDAKDDVSEYAGPYMSKKPPLGDEYFKHLAQTHVTKGVSPKTLHYSWPDLLDKKGRQKQYYMTGVTADNYLDHYVHLCNQQNGGKYPPSQLVDEHIDKRVSEEWELERIVKDLKDGETRKQKITDWVLLKNKVHPDVECYYSIGQVFAKKKDGTLLLREDWQIFDEEITKNTTQIWWDNYLSKQGA